MSSRSCGDVIAPWLKTGPTRTGSLYGLPIYRWCRKVQHFLYSSGLTPVFYTAPLSNLIRLVQHFLSTAQVRVVQLFCTQNAQSNSPYAYTIMTKEIANMSAMCTNLDLRFLGLVYSSEFSSAVVHVLWYFRWSPMDVSAQTSEDTFFQMHFLMSDV